MCVCVCQYILVHVKKTLSLLIHGIVQFSALGIQAQGPHGDSTVPGTADAETARDVETQGLDRDLGRPINVLGIFELLLKSIRYRNIYIYRNTHTNIYMYMCVQSFYWIILGSFKCLLQHIFRVHRDPSSFGAAEARGCRHCWWRSSWVPRVEIAKKSVTIC